MAWTRVKSDEQVVTAGTTVTPDLGSNPSAGNLLAANLGTDNDRQHCTPCGWTHIVTAVVACQGSKVSSYFKISAGDEQTVGLSICGCNDQLRAWYQEMSSDGTIPCCPVGCSQASNNACAAITHTTGVVSLTQDSYISAVFMLAGVVNTFDNGWTNCFTQSSDCCACKRMTTAFRLTTAAVCCLATTEGWCDGQPLRAVATIIGFSEAAPAVGGVSHFQLLGIGHHDLAIDAPWQFSTGVSL